ncbi:hypothetical protein DPMN_151813 [Dreissena polymorpha]|uniref:Uncharacterized protein n=1 Tax=Dreissena polymorpha TaxID=45954 RepID=A0A9D4FFS9_DREPO|nr:hypothetical protein DPMN_151813 [Dreissena polymorpha]
MPGRGRGRKRRAQEALPPIEGPSHSQESGSLTIDFQNIIAQSGILPAVSTAGCGSVGYTSTPLDHIEHPSITQSVVQNTPFMQQPLIDSSAISNTAALQQVRLSNDDLAIHVPNQI